MMKLEPGGRPGGEVKFLIGAVMTLAGLWFFFDSVQITSGHGGWISNALGGRGGGWPQTTSTGAVLLPLLAGIIALFFDARSTWGWVLTGVGLIVLLIEMVSRFRPVFSLKATHFIILLVLFGGGIGLMLKAYLEDRQGGSGDRPGDGTEA